MANAVGNGTVLWELDSRGVATVSLNRPEVNNAYNGDLIGGVHAALGRAGRGRTAVGSPPAVARPVRNSPRRGEGACHA